MLKIGIAGGIGISMVASVGMFLTMTADGKITIETISALTFVTLTLSALVGLGIGLDLYFKESLWFVLGFGLGVVVMWGFVFGSGWMKLAIAGGVFCAFTATCFISVVFGWILKKLYKFF